MFTQKFLSTNMHKLSRRTCNNFAAVMSTAIQVQTSHCKSVKCLALSFIKRLSYCIMSIRTFYICTEHYIPIHVRVGDRILCFYFRFKDISLYKKLARLLYGTRGISFSEHINCSKLFSKPKHTLREETKPPQSKIF